MHRVHITDTTLRDAHQSLIATRLRTEDSLPLARAIEKAGFFSVEAWGGATFDTAIRFCNDDPWDRLSAFSEALQKTPIQMLLRGQNLVGYRHYPDDVVEGSWPPPTAGRGYLPGLRRVKRPPEHEEGHGGGEEVGCPPPGGHLLYHEPGSLDKGVHCNGRGAPRDGLRLHLHQGHGGAHQAGACPGTHHRDQEGDESSPWTSTATPRQASPP